MLYRYLMIFLVLGISYSLVATSFSSTSLNEKSANLNGVRLKFMATHYPPHNILTLMPNGNYTDIGTTPLFFDWLTKKLNFTIVYDYIPNKMTKSQYGNLGEIAFALKVVGEKKFDGSSRFIIASYERMKSMDFAIFMWAEPLVMVAPRPGEEPRIFAFVHPFQSTVWLLIFIAGFTIVVFMTIFSGIYYKLKLSLDPDISTNIIRKFTMHVWFTYFTMYMINTMTNQGNSIPLHRFSFRILIGVWVLVATVLVNSYSGTVISYLTVPKMKPPINTFQDLVASEDVDLIVLADTVTKQQIMEATHGAQKILGDEIRRNPDRMLNTLEEITVRLQTERYAFGTSQSYCNNFVAKQFQEKGKCRFKTTDSYSMTMFFSMPLQKDSKYTTIFKNALMELWETGLPEFWVKNGIPRAPKCFEKVNERANAVRKPIRLTDLSGAFFILGVGFGIAAFVFLAESIIFFKPLANKLTAVEKKIEFDDDHGSDEMIKSVALPVS